MSELSADVNGNVSQNGGTSTTDTVNGQRISSAANFTGTVTAATSLLAPTIDTASGVALNIGTSGAPVTTGINLNQSTTVASGKNLTLTSGNFAQTSAATTQDANAITASGLTTGTALKVTSTENSAANTSWSAVQFNPTNAQGTTAVTGANMISGLNVQFTQAPTVAGNNETVANLAVAANGGSPTDNTVSSILNLANNDTATGNQIGVTDAINVNSAGGAGSIVNGITIAGGTSAVTNGLNFTGTLGGNLINSTNFTVSQAGAVVGVGVNSGSGLLQGTGGLTVTGTTQINATTAGTTTIGSSTAGAVAIASGGVSSFNVTSNNLTLSTLTSGTLAVTSAGALNLTGAAASTITTGANSLAVTSSDFNVTTGGVVNIVGGSAGFQIGGAATTGNYLRGNGTSFVSSAIQASDATGVFVKNVPAATSDNVINPGATSGVVALTLRGGSSGTPDILDVRDSSNALQDFFDSAGRLNVAQIIQPTTNNAVDLGVTSTNAFRTGYFATSVLGPLFDTASAGTLSLGTGTATTVNEGSVGSTVKGTAVHINDTSDATNTQAVTIGSTAANTNDITTIQGGSSTTGAIVLTPNTAGAILIGAVGGTGNITLGSSSAGENVLLANGAGAPSVSIANVSVSGVTVNIAGAANTSSNVVNIANGATAANTTVAILSGVGTAGAGTLSLGNNTRVTTIDLGNIAPAAARTTTIAGGGTGVVDTVNIATGAATVAGGKTVHIADTAPTGSGSNTVTIGSTALGSTTNIQAGTGNTNVKTNNSSISSPMLSLQQAGGGDASEEFRDATTSWYEGPDADTSDTFDINSNYAAAFGSILGDNYTSTTPNASDANANFYEGSKFTATSTGTISALSASFNFIINGSSAYSLAIYSDSSGTPGSLLGQHTGASLITLPGGNNFNTQTLDSPVSVTSGTAYWIVLATNDASGFNTIHPGPGGSASKYLSGRTAGTWCALWNSGAGCTGVQTSTTDEIGLYGTVSATLTDTFSNPLFMMSTSGQANFRNVVNSTTAFQVQNAASTNLFQVDTLNNIVNVGSTGATALGSTVNLGNSSGGVENVNVGSTNSTSKTIIQGGSGTIAGTGAAIQLNSVAAGDISIGSTTMTGIIAVGQSTQTNTINIGSAVVAGSKTQTINIGNGAGAGTAINVSILSGVGTAGTGTLSLGNNTRVQTIDLGNIAPAQTRTTTVAGGASGVVDTVNIGTGAASVAGGKTINIGTTTPTSTGSNLITIGTNANFASTTAIQGGNGATAITLTPQTTGQIVVGAAAGTGQITLGSSSGGQTVVVGGGTGANIVQIANGVATATGNQVSIAGGATANGFTDTVNIATGNSAGGGNGAKVVHIADGTPAGTGINTVTIGSLTNASATTIQGGTGNINLNTNQAGSGTVVKSVTTNSSVAFQLQNNIGSSLLNADTTTQFGNLVFNPGGEATLAATDWSNSFGTGATDGRNTANVWSGADSISVATTGSANSGAKNVLGNVALASSTAYSLTFYAKASGSNFSTLNVDYLYDGTNSDGTVSCTGNTVVTGGWTRYSCFFTTSASGTHTKTTNNAIVIYQSDAATRTFYLDGVQLQQVATTANSYGGSGALRFDGVVTSPVQFQNSDNSTAALSVTSAAGVALLTADTLNSKVISTGTTQLGSAAGTGALVNNGSTVNNAYTMANLTSGGWDAGGAAATVDKYTYIAANQTSGSQTLTVPTPTASTTYGRLVYLSNVGSVAFTLQLSATVNSTLNAGSTATIVWANTNTTPSWQFAGADGSSILNQNATSQSASFHINGTAQVDGNTTVGSVGSTNLFKNNGATQNVSCAYTGLSGTFTPGFATAGKTVNDCTSFTLTDTGATSITSINAPTAGAGSIIYISNLAASTNPVTLLTLNLNAGSTATMVYDGASWRFAGADSSSLQSDYYVSGGASPSILESTTNGPVTVQPLNSGGMTGASEIFGVHAAHSSDTLGSSIISAVSYGLGVNLGTDTAQSGFDIQFGGNADRVLGVISATTANQRGANLTVSAGSANGSTTGAVGGALNLNGGNAAGSGSFNGGAVAIQGGTSNANATAVGGAVTITGGSAGALAGAMGGAITLTAGAGTSTTTGAAGSAVAINGGAAGGTGANAGGAVTVTGGTATAAGAGGLVTVQGGAASATAGSTGGGLTLQSATGGISGSGTAAGNAGALQITSGNGGANSSSGAGGNGADITITGGSGGTAGTGANGNGGSIKLVAGNAGGGAGTNGTPVGSSRVDLQACKLEYSIVSPK